MIWSGHVLFFSFLDFIYLFVDNEEETDDSIKIDYSTIPGIIQGVVWGTIIIVMITTWLYCLCWRKKARMTQEQKDQEHKEKWEKNNEKNNSDVFFKKVLNRWKNSTDTVECWFWAPSLNTNKIMNKIWPVDILRILGQLNRKQDYYCE